MSERANISVFENLQRQAHANMGSAMGVFNEAVAKSAMVRLVIDMKNNAEEWWDGGGRDLWDMVNQQYDGTWGEVILPRENAEQFLLYAKKIPGWKSKSAISSVPIMMYDVDDDE